MPDGVNKLTFTEKQNTHSCVLHTCAVESCVLVNSLTSYIVTIVGEIRDSTLCHSNLQHGIKLILQKLFFVAVEADAHFIIYVGGQAVLINYR